MQTYKLILIKFTIYLSFINVKLKLKLVQIKIGKIRGDFTKAILQRIFNKSQLILTTVIKLDSILGLF